MQEQYNTYLEMLGISLDTPNKERIAEEHENRVKELKEFKNVLNIMKTKMKFTYEPLEKIFKEISSNNSTKIEEIFGKMSNQILYGQVKDKSYKL